MLISLLRKDGSTRDEPARRPDLMPPFFELEELIAQGHDQSTALAVMAQRRGTANLQIFNPFEAEPVIRISA